MKEYLKMEDAFSRKVDPITDWDEHGHEVKWITLLSHQAEHAAHAINSHDELVAEVDRLRGLIERIISSAQELAKKMPSTEFGEGYKQCAMDTASAIESCANKGA